MYRVGQKVSLRANERRSFREKRELCWTIYFVSLYLLINSFLHYKDLPKGNNSVGRTMVN